MSGSGRVGLTQRGAGLAATGAVLLTTGLLWRYPGVAAFGGALLCTVLAGLVSVLRPVPVTIHRTIAPPEVSRYGECTATVRIRRPGGLLALRLDAVEHVAGAPVPLRLPALGPGRAVEVSYPVPTQRRGVLPIGPFESRVVGVAGTARRHTRLGGTVEIRVLPRVLPVRGLPAGLRRGHSGGTERVERGGTDLTGLREYAPGDDLRRLHWATSARTGTLMVREDADPPWAHLTVLLDDRASAYQGDGLEDAVEVAASLAVAAVRSGHDVRLLTVCRQADLAVTGTGAAGTGRTGRELVARLAGVTAQVGPPGTGALLPGPHRDVVVVVTGGAAGLARLLREAAAAATGIVAVLDPAPDTALDTAPGIGTATAAGTATAPGTATATAAGAATVAGGVTILRGQSSVDILRLWDAMAVRR